MTSFYKPLCFICISLTHRQDRRQAITTMMEQVRSHIPNIDFDLHFFDAVYGKNLPIEYLHIINTSRALAKQCNRTLGSNEIGCLLSHLCIWQKLIQLDYQHYQRVIILEDDIIFNPNRFAEKIQQFLHDDPDFAFLGGHTAPSKRRIRGYIDASQYCFHMTGPSDLYTAAYAYSITPKTAQQFSEKIIKKVTYLDDWKYLLSSYLSVPYYYCFDHNNDSLSSIADDRKTFDLKPNRLQKNWHKIKNDVISRCLSFIVMCIKFKKITRLATFLEQTGDGHYKNH